MKESKMGILQMTKIPSGSNAQRTAQKSIQGLDADVRFERNNRSVGYGKQCAI